MDTPTTATPDRRQASQPSQATGANGQANHLPRQARHPAGESDDRRLTRADVAALLGVSVPALRRLQSRADVPGTPEPRAAGGSVLVFTEADVAALRQASQATGAATESGAPAGVCRDTRQARQPSQAAEPTPHEAAGWSEALAESRARAALAEARADTLTAELAVARVEAQDARRRAEEAERALAATNDRLGALRAAWWRWQAQLATLGPVARWRRRWPVVPGEFEAEPLLAKPVE